jgi:hypothetical protein
MPSSGMLHRVALVRTDIAEDCFLHSHLCENLKSYTAGNSYLLFSLRHKIMLHEVTKLKLLKLN